MDFKLRPCSSAESFKEKYSRSTVFDATIEQALICSSGSRKTREILNIRRERIGLRSSSTFESSVFGESIRVRPRVNYYKPRDSISLDHHGNSPSEFYRKSIVSDFQPNFQPKYKYESTWAVDPQTFTKQTESEAKKDLWIKPIIKKNPALLNKSPLVTYKTCENRAKSPQVFQSSQKSECSQGIFCKSTRPSSKFTSRSNTPKPRLMSQAILYTEQNRINTEESLYSTNALQTEPDFSKRSILMNINNRVDQTCRKKAVKEPLKSGESVFECKPWDFSKEIFRTKEDVKERNNYDQVVKAWRTNRVLAIFSQDDKVPNYMRKTISSICKSKKVE